MKKTKRNNVSRRMHFFAATFVCLVSLSLYARTSQFDYTRTDDKVLIQEDAFFLSDINNIPKSFSRTFFPQARGHKNERSESYYRPLVTVSLILDAQWKGPAPTVFHITNVFLHAIACVIFLFVLWEVGIGFWPSFFAALVFSTHPVLTESVAWIPGRCDSLLAVFLFAAMFCFVRHEKTRSKRTWLGFLVFWLAALFTKEAAVVLPVVLVLFQLHKLKTERPPWTKLASIFAAGAIWLLALSQVRSLASESLTERLRVFLQNVPVLFMHLEKILVPWNLTVLAIVKDSSWVLGAIATPLLAFIGFKLKNDERRLYLFGLSIFLLFLLPTLPVSDFLILENRLYVPTAGVMLAMAAAIEAFLKVRPHAQRPMAVAATLCVCVFFVMTWRYAEAFASQEAFTEEAVRGSPHSDLAQLNRGIVHHARNELEEARMRYLKVLELNPNMTVLHNNLGLLAMNTGDWDTAEKEYRLELTLNPGYSKAHFNLAIVLRHKGLYEEAAESFRQALRYSPDDIETMNELYGYHRFRNQPAEAEFYAQEMRKRGAEPRQ